MAIGYFKENEICYKTDNYSGPIDENIEIDLEYKLEEAIT
jgi:hypothetical protein